MLRAKTWRKSLYFLSLSLIVGAIALTEGQQGWAKQVKNNEANSSWPTRRFSAGRRGECLINGQKQFCPPSVAVVPESLLLTSSATPTLFFALPPLVEQEKVKIEFVLRDRQDRLVYEKTFTLTNKQALMGLTIPQDQNFPGLEQGQAYHWYLSIIYKAGDRSYDDVLEGWIRYQPLESTYARQLQQATPLEKAAIYQETERWSEAVQTLVDLKNQQPNDPIVAQQWDKLLTKLDLTF